MESTTADALVELLQYGVLGAVVYGLLRGWLWARPSVEQLLASIQRLTQENQALREEIQSLKSRIAVLEERDRKYR